MTAFASKAVIERLPKSDGAHDASPGALRRLVENARENADLNKLIGKATTDEPLRPALSRALVDAWSMTSLGPATSSGWKCEAGSGTSISSSMRKR